MVVGERQTVGKELILPEIGGMSMLLVHFRNLMEKACKDRVAEFVS